MTRVLVVWEDAKCEALGELAKRMVRVTARAPDVELPRIVRHTSRGNGTFAHYVNVTWPQVRAKGAPADPGLIDHLICVVDGDRLHDLIAGVGKAPSDAAEVAAWHAAAATSWQAWLRARCDPGGPAATTVHGIVLRWAKESLVLAGYDQPAVAEHLDVHVTTDAAAELLRKRCPVPPSTVEDRLFTDTFRRPLGCLDLLRQVEQRGALKKNVPAIDYALRALTRDSLSVIRSRVPDIDRLAALIWDLHRGNDQSAG